MTARKLLVPLVAVRNSGADPVPWLPALAGACAGSAATTGDTTAQISARVAGMRPARFFMGSIRLSLGKPVFAGHARRDSLARGFRLSGFQSHIRISARQSYGVAEI